MRPKPGHHPDMRGSGADIGSRTTATPLRVLFLIDHLNRERGGAENQAFLLLANMPRDRIAMRLACFDGRAEDFADLAAAGVGVDILPRPSRRVWPLSVVAKTSEIVREHRIEVVQAFLPTLDILAPFLRFRHPRLPIATSRRCLDEYLRPRHLRLLRRTGKFAHAIVANSTAVAESVRRLEGNVGARLRVIPNALPAWPPVDRAERAEARTRLGIGEGEFVIAYPAHFRDGKGHRHLPELVRLLAASVPEARVLVAGDTTGDVECRRNSAALFAAIDAGDLGGSIRCLGLLPAIRPLLAAADATLNLSDMEGMSNTLMEGMALGLPVVATNVGGTPELIEDGREGLLVQLGDVEAAAEQLARLARDAGLRDRLGGAAREKITRDFSVSRLVDSYADLYESLAGRTIARWPGASLSAG
jgi:glycosyltransferase involved in cell wall biosynthesis